MDKKTYYIAVGSGTILEDQADGAFDFEIEATPKEIEQLQKLFTEQFATDWQSFLRAHIPIKPYSEDKPNDAYDENLHNVYRAIYQLGTPRTKQFIEEHGLLTLTDDAHSI
ncbi:hypothetical protein [Numidum massiliense]|uniref:hypothetical protein n=1 Tax=Numidum massiliense TaxID=1522315 RepID=UPI0006D5A3BF|nr:hypothetical protein [Numidum massiliense]